MVVLRQGKSNLPRPRKGQRFGGRQKGTPNKFTKSIKQSFEDAFHELQNDKYANLVTWARANPDQYYKLAARLVPHELVGAGGGPLQVTGVVSVYMPDNGRRNDGPVLIQPPGNNKPLRIQPRARSGAPKK